MRSTLDRAAYKRLDTLAATLPPTPAVVAPGFEPVHTLYGGAHLFKATTAARLGELAAAHLQQYAPTAAALVAALGWEAHPEDEQRYARLQHKLKTAAVEDLRVDFEDGYGERGDAEEDAQAERVGEQAALAPCPPAGFGIRIKALSPRLWRRAARTLELFCGALARGCGHAGRPLPAPLYVTLPKVEHRAEVELAVLLVSEMEKALGWPARTLALELMLESPAPLGVAGGGVTLRGLVEAASGRCRSVHFGAYDYLAACGVTAVSGGLRHPACDAAREGVRLALAGTGVRGVDGATQVLPLPRHPSAPTAALQEENIRGVHAAWRLHADNIEHALRGGWYQGWDLHPGQLIPRYAAVYRFFRNHLSVSTRRLEAFLAQAATSSTVGEYFDDAASALGLVQFFRRGLACGALDAADMAPSGLTPAALMQGDLRALAADRGRLLG